MHGLQLSPDFTIFIQLGIFFACYFVLKILVFNPYLALLEARHQKTDGLKEKAEKEKLEAEEYKQKYEKFIHERRKNTQAWMELERKKATEQEQALIAEAKSKVKSKIDSTRVEIKSQTEVARKELEKQIPEIANVMSNKLLGKKAGSIKIEGSNSNEPQLSSRG